MSCSETDQARYDLKYYVNAKKVELSDTVVGYYAVLTVCIMFCSVSGKNKHLNSKASVIVFRDILLSLGRTCRLETF